MAKWTLVLSGIYKIPNRTFFNTCCRSSTTVLLSFFGITFWMLSIFIFYIENYLFPSERPSGFQGVMRILFWVVLILFTIVSTKIVHYSSLAYFPLSYLASVEIQKLQFGKKLSMFFKTIFIAFALILSMGLTISIYTLVAQPKFISEKIPNIHIQEIMNTPLDWNGFEYLIPLLILVGSMIFIIMSSKRLIQSVIIYLLFLGMFFSFLQD